MEDLKYRNSTTPTGPTTCIQNSSVLSLQRVATATTTAIIPPFIVPVEGQHVSTISTWNKIQVYPRRPPSLTLKKTGDGMVVTGKSLGRIAIAITAIVIRGKLFGLYPARITSYVNHLNMAVTARQRIDIKANRNEKENGCNLPHYAPCDH